MNIIIRDMKKGGVYNKNLSRIIRGGWGGVKT
jgi:hypothetical protein